MLLKAFVLTIGWCVPYSPGIRLLSSAIIFGKFKLNKTQVLPFGRLRRGNTSRIGNLQTNMQPQSMEPTENPMDTSLRAQLASYECLLQLYLAQ